MSKNRYQSADAIKNSELDVAELVQRKTSNHCGIGRVKFVLYYLFVALGIGGAAAQVGLPEAGFCIGIAIQLIAVVQRIINMGYRAITFLAMAVPFVNIAFLLLCFIAPPGFADDRKLDKSAFIAAMVILLSAVVIVLLLMQDT